MSWEIDRFHSLVEFAVEHLKIATVRGQFTDVHGTIELDQQNPERSSVKVEIVTNSIHTGVSQRDTHLRTADFLEVSKYPTMTFASTAVKYIGNNRFIIGGDLSLHGVTRPVQLRSLYTGTNKDMLTDAWRIGLRSHTVIDRRDFGMTYNQSRAETLLIGNEVYIDIIVEAILME